MNNIYPDYLEKLIKIVALSRSKRIGSKLAKLSDAEKPILLKRYHPDFSSSAFRTLRVGVNRGGRIANEVADLLESFSNINLHNIRLEAERDTDVLVIGGGGAGVTAALFAQSSGAKVILANKLRLGNSNTIMAMGGMQTAIGENDSPARHLCDTYKGGKFCGKKELLQALIEDSGKIVKWLIDIGINFDKDTDGNLILKKGGGSSAPRILSVGDHTGLNIMKVLKDELRNRDGIDVVEFAPAVELTTNEIGECNGAIFYDLVRKRYFVIKAKAVILAAGGSGRLHIQGFPTSNNFGATGDAIVLAYRAGAKLIDLDSYQYHPTGVMFPSHMFGLLVTEAIRSLGGQLINVNGAQFVNELETRDIVSAAMIKEVGINGVKTPDSKMAVWLDTPLIGVVYGRGFMANRFPSLYMRFKVAGIDLFKTPILVYPTLHYQNGGILINSDSESTINNLFVAGEATGGIHGKNRLMGNALLDIFVFGRRAGIAAARRGHPNDGKQTLYHIDRYDSELKDMRITSKTHSPLLFQDFIITRLQ